MPRSPRPPIAFEAPASLTFDFSPMRKAIDEMAERQRRLFENVDRVIKQGLPANLRDVHSKPALEDIVEDEGIPVAHVPRGAIVQELVDCPDHKARRAVLAARVS